MGKQVLVVDDSATVRQQVRSALSQAGFEVVEAVDRTVQAVTVGALADDVVEAALGVRLGVAHLFLGPEVAGEQHPHRAVFG